MNKLIAAYAEKMSRITTFFRSYLVLFHQLKLLLQTDSYIFQKVLVRVQFDKFANHPKD